MTWDENLVSCLISVNIVAMLVGNQLGILAAMLVANLLDSDWYQLACQQVLPTILLFVPPG